MSIENKILGTITDDDEQPLTMAKFMDMIQLYRQIGKQGIPRDIIASLDGYDKAVSTQNNSSASQSSIDKIWREIGMLKDQMTEILSMVKQEQQKKKDIEDRSEIIAWHINQSLKDSKNVRYLYIEIDGKTTTFHIVVAADTFAETNLIISNIEMKMKRLFPDDIIRFRTHDERGFRPEIYEGCYEYESETKKSQSL